MEQSCRYLTTVTSLYPHIITSSHPSFLTSSGSISNTNVFPYTSTSCFFLSPNSHSTHSLFRLLICIISRLFLFSISSCHLHLIHFLHQTAGSTSWTSGSSIHRQSVHHHHPPQSHLFLSSSKPTPPSS